MRPTLDLVRAAVDRPPRLYDAPIHAAVAVVVLPDLDLLFMRRAERDSDPWSGHIAFPGGRVDPTDRDALHAAMREANEELGLELGPTALLGRLDTVEPASGKLPLAIHPFVFTLGAEPQLRPNHEVASVHRLGLDALLAGLGRGPMQLTWQGQCYTLPRVDFDGVRLWGLTLRIVDDLLDRLDGQGIGLKRPMT